MSAMRWRRVLQVSQALGHRMFWVPHSGSDILAARKAPIQWLGRRMMYFSGGKRPEEAEEGRVTRQLPGRGWCSIQEAKEDGRDAGRMEGARAVCAAAM